MYRRNGTGPRTVPTHFHQIALLVRDTDNVDIHCVTLACECLVNVNHRKHNHASCVHGNIIVVGRSAVSWPETEIRNSRHLEVRLILFRTLW